MVRGIGLFIGLIAALFSVCANTSSAQATAERILKYGGTFPDSPTVDVTVRVTGKSGTEVTVVETPPAGWTIKKINASGQEAGGVITWSVTCKSTPTSLTYNAAPPRASGTGVFGGIVGDEVIGGQTEISLDQYATGVHIPFKTGLYYNYLVYLPKSYVPGGKKWPVIVFLHSWSERGTILTAVMNFALAKLAGDPARVMDVLQSDEFPFILIAPQAPSSDGVWKEPEFMDVLNEVLPKFSVDTNRMYLTGTSFGGGASWDFACLHPDLFSAIVPISGGPSKNSNLKNLVGSTAVWAFHNRNDSVTGMSGNKKGVDDVKALGGEAQLTIFEGTAHDAWTNGYNTSELYPWLLRHSKSTDCEAWMLHP